MRVNNCVLTLESQGALKIVSAFVCVRELDSITVDKYESTYVSLTNLLYYYNYNNQLLMNNVGD